MGNSMARRSDYIQDNDALLVTELHGRILTNSNTVLHADLLESFSWHNRMTSILRF